MTNRDGTRVRPVRHSPQTRDLRGAPTSLMEIIFYPIHPRWTSVFLIYSFLPNSNVALTGLASIWNFYIFVHHGFFAFIFIFKNCALKCNLSRVSFFVLPYIYAWDECYTCLTPLPAFLLPAICRMLWMWMPIAWKVSEAWRKQTQSCTHGAAQTYNSNRKLLKIIWHKRRLGGSVD